MAQAKKLPSGSWRIRVTDSETGKRVSFTADTKNEAELMALEFLNGKRKKPTAERTLEELMLSYIDSKSNILSPTTINFYHHLLRNDFQEIKLFTPSQLTHNRLQQHFNELALKLSPKSVHNAYGFFISVMNVYNPDVRYHVSIPKLKKRIRQMPSIETIVNVLRGTKGELACMLAIWLGLRLSEIKGIRWEDIQGNVLSIRNVMVTIGSKEILKSATKTYESTRQLIIPDYIMRLIEQVPKDQEFIIKEKSSAIRSRFTRLLDKNGIEHISFHDLRHLNASAMVMLGIPDKYAMERGGWSTTNILKSVYQHTFTEERKKVDATIDNYFYSLLDTKMDTEK